MARGVTRTYTGAAHAHDAASCVCRRNETARSSWSSLCGSSSATMQPAMWCLHGACRHVSRCRSSLSCCPATTRPATCAAAALRRSSTPGMCLHSACRRAGMRRSSVRYCLAKIRPAMRADVAQRRSSAEQLVQLGLPLLCNAQQKRALLPLHDDAAGKCGHDRATRLWASGPVS